MATYKPGTNEDHVIKTESVGHDLDLTIYIKKFKNIRNALLAIPGKKLTPDQETLDHWMETVYLDGQEEKERLNQEAVLLYELLKPIKEAGLLPIKYNSQYNQLKTYIENL